VLGTIQDNRGGGVGPIGGGFGSLLWGRGDCGYGDRECAALRCASWGSWVVLSWALWCAGWLGRCPALRLLMGYFYQANTPSQD
jgi:hypothetical protein